MSTTAYGCAVVGLRVLGPVEVVDPAGEPIDIGGRQARMVLAALCIAEGRPVTADALIETAVG